MPAELLRRACKECKCPLVFVPGPNGKLIPLDERTQAYRIGADMLGNPIAEPLPGVHVSHFATCPKANNFSGSKR